MMWFMWAWAEETIDWIVGKAASPDIEPDATPAPVAPTSYTIHFKRNASTELWNAAVSEVPACGAGQWPTPLLAVAAALEAALRD